MKKFVCVLSVVVLLILYSLTIFADFLGGEIQSTRDGEINGDPLPVTIEESSTIASGIILYSWPYPNVE